MSLRNASIHWADGNPLSTEFDDIYFSKTDGRAETQHVFIAGNRIPERLKKITNQPFIIGETGFGTGANFLCTLALLQGTQQRLHFISTELYPLQLQDLAKALDALPQYRHWSDQLLAQYPPLIPGMHQLSFDKGRHLLTLCFGDAASMLAELDTPVDAWYLDGFAPSKNPQMWSPELFTQLARLSKPDQTTLATFTAAGMVRRGLAEVGFTMSKVNGYGRKREMLTGIFDTHQHPFNHPAPWFRLPQPDKRPRTAIVIGAGLAGCTSARALAQRGIAVTLLDRQKTLAEEGSGNRQGALYAKPSIQPTASSQLHLCGLEYSRRLISDLDLNNGIQADLCGLLQLATHTKEAARQQQILTGGLYSPQILQAVNASQASRIAGVNTPHGGLFFPRAGWVSPRDFCNRLIASQSGIEFVANQQAEEILYQDNQWHVKTATRTFSANVLIIACAEQSQQFGPLAHLPLKPIRGQVSLARITQPHFKLNSVICAEGYVTPALQGILSFGATFNLHEQTPAVRQEDHETNAGNLSAVIPDSLTALEPMTHWQGKVGYRCTTPDYLPIVGPAPIQAAYQEQYARLSQDRKWPFADEPAPVHTGLFINTGHGSKGLITAPLTSEYLAAMICNEPLPLPRSLTAALHPGRFLIRQLIRTQN